MKQLFKRGALAMAALTAMTAVNAGTPLFSYDFNVEDTGLTQFSVLDANNDGVTWAWAKYTTSGQYYYAKCYNWNTSSYNDFMTTNEAVTLNPGRAYRLRFQAWAESSVMGSSVAQMAAGYTTDASLQEVTLLGSKDLMYPNKYQGEQGEYYDFVFEVPETGNYYFTFRAGGTVGSAIDNITLEDIGTPYVPGPVQNLTVTPAADFSLQATVSGVLPSVTVTGAELASITKVEISRGETVVATLTSGLTPGASFSWTDENSQAGNVTYSVKVSNGDLTGESVEASAYVGPLTPRNATNVTLTPGEEADTYVIDWTAPVKSINDITLDPTMLTFDINRVVGGQSTQIATGVTGTSYTDTYVPTERTTLKYEVTARYGSASANAAVSPEKTIGTATLPFADSFAGAKLSDNWTAVAINGSKNWQAVATSSSPSAQPQDSDGGLVYYNSYSASRNFTARLQTTEILTSSATNATVEFWFYHHTSGADQMEVQVQTDGGEWTTVPGSQITVQGTPSGWTKYTYGIQSMIEGSQKFSVGFLATSAYGYNTVMDNVTIYNALQYNMVMTAFDAPAQINAGQEATMTATLTNRGASTVAAGDYTVDFYVGDQMVCSVPGVEIESCQTLNVAYPHIFRATEAGEEPYDLSARISYAADQDNDDNNSQTIQTTVGLSVNPGVMVAQGEADEQGNITLTWQPAMDSTGYEPTDINETFADAEAYVRGEEEEAPTTLTFCGWTARDLDGGETGTRYSYSSSIWNVFDAGSNSYAPKGSAGKVLSVITPKTGLSIATSDDWLISPEITPFPGATFDVTVRLLAMDSKAAFQILYSETDAEPDSFTSVGDFTNNYNSGSSNWAEYTAEVPGSAKYVAIRNVTPAASSQMICIDWIKVQSQLAIVAGYNVYEDGEIINEAPIEECQYAVPASVQRDATQQRAFAVTALYVDGETALSAPVYVAVGTGVAELDAMTRSFSTVRGGIMAYDNVEVYNLDGRRVAVGNGMIRLEAGLYIVRQGKQGVRIIVK